MKQPSKNEKEPPQAKYGALRDKITAVTYEALRNAAKAANAATRR